MFARTSSSLVSKTKSNSNTAARKEVPNIYGIPRDAVFAPLAGLLVSQLVLYIGVGVLLPALPLYAQSIGLSQSANGLVISAPALAMLILNVPTGQMADRYGRKPVMIAGLGIMAVADIGTALAKTMVFLIPTRLLLGVDLTKRVPEKRGIITAAQAMVHGFGLVIGPLIGGSALDEYGPATAFYVVGFAAVGTAIGYAFLPETLSESERSTDEDFFGSADDNDDGDANNAANNNGNTMPSFLKFLNLKNMTKRDKKSNLGKLLKDPDQRLLLTCAAANSFGFVAKLTVIPLFASGQLHATSLQVGELFSLTALLGLATAPVSGLLSDAIGKRWVLTGSLALCALGLAVGSGSEDLETLRLAVGCWGIGCAAAGESLTLPKTAADIVFLVGPIILGGANDLTDSQGAGILITAAIAGVASIVCAYGAVTYKKPPQRFEQRREQGTTAGASGASETAAPEDDAQKEQRAKGFVASLDKNIVDNVLNTRHVQNLRERLDEIKYTKEFITIDKFAELCKESGCTEKKPEEYVDIMKNAGLVIQIEDYVYLEPQNITRAVINALPGVPPRIYGVSDAELRKLNEEYDQMREKVVLAEKKAARRATQLLYGGFIVLIAQLAVFVRFTYVEFSWDVMEPISYFVGLANVIMGYMYFMYTQRDFSFGTWQNQMMQSAMDRQLKTGKFDVTKYEQMARKLRRRNMIR
ncbi:unnamed protein product [Bathycoccus prasinos]